MGLLAKGCPHEADNLHNSTESRMKIFYSNADSRLPGMGLIAGCVEIEADTVKDMNENEFNAHVMESIECQECTGCDCVDW